MPLRDPAELRAFVLAHTTVVATPLVPELPLHLATEVTPLWHATERWLAERGIEPPFWAFAWAGGQAIARWLLDHPEVVRGRSVLDFASGSGLVALAAARAGARHVIAVDRDPLAGAATALNAERLGLAVEVRTIDLLGADASDPDATANAKTDADASAERDARTPAWARACEVVTAGDVCYDAAWAAPAMAWLRGRARAGVLALLGDPGRMYLPERGLELLARHRVPLIDDIEGQRERDAAVYRVLPDEGSTPPEILSDA